MAVAITLHLLASIVWVGGMFFAHMALRPALEEQLEPPRRLALMGRVLHRFFRWVWVSVTLILASGYWMFLGVYGGQAALYVHLMQGLGLVMAGLFAYVFFVPFRRMRAALGDQDLSSAGRQLVLTRRIIAVNLVLGLVTSALGAAGRYG